MMGMGAKWFLFTDQVENLLFYKFSTTSPAELIVVCVGITVISFLFEVVKVTREFLLMKMGKTCCEQTIINEASQLTTCRSQLSKKTKILLHAVQTVLHMKQIFLGYILMLCVMSFNAWFMLTAVFGLTFGYFLCGALLPKAFDENIIFESEGLASPSYASTSVSELSPTTQLTSAH